MPTPSAPTLRSLALLEHAVVYTRDALAAVDDGDLDAATPCTAWTLRGLLWHMDDSLAAFTEAAEHGRVDLAPRRPDAGAHELADRLRIRACTMLVAWQALVTDEPVDVGGSRLPPGLLAGVGALEIAVHGWDVARSVDLDHPLPDRLAVPLLDVAEDVVGHEDRGTRFAPELATDAVEETAGARLLAFLGRR